MKKTFLFVCALVFVAPCAFSQRAAADSGTEVAPVFDEEATYEYTRPIPIDGTPLGCHVIVTERICRTDRRRVVAVEVLSKTVVGTSSLNSAAVDSEGCVRLRSTIGVSLSNAPSYKCIGGKGSIAVRLLLKAEPHPASKAHAP